MELNDRLAQDGTARAPEAEPDVEPVGDTAEQSGPTVVGLLSQIVGVLKDAGLIHSEKEKDGEKTSPFARRHFGLNFQQAQRGNGMCIFFPDFNIPDVLEQRTTITRSSTTRISLIISMEIASQSFQRNLGCFGYIMMRPSFSTTISLPSSATVLTCHSFLSVSYKVTETNLTQF